MRFYQKMEQVGGTKRKKKGCRGEAGVDYCPFSSYGSDIVSCVATGKAQAQVHARAQHGLACTEGRVATRARHSFCIATRSSTRDMVFVSQHVFCVATGGGM